MINWQAPVTITGNIIFPDLITSRAILVSIISTLSPVWRKAGALRIEALFEGEFITISYQSVNFGKSLVSLPAVQSRLTFEPARDLVTIYPNTTIAFYPLTITQALALMPIYEGQTPSIEQPVIDSVPTTFTAVGYLAATAASAYQCLAANPARQRFSVTNLGAASIYLDFDAPTDGFKRYIAIAAGSTYVSDFPYVGAVFVWSSKTQTQTCEVRDFIQ